MGSHLSGWVRDRCWQLQAHLLQCHLAGSSHVGFYHGLGTAALWSLTVFARGVDDREAEMEDGDSCLCFHLSSLLWLLDFVGLSQWWLLWAGTLIEVLHYESWILIIQVQHQLLFSVTEAISTVMVLRLADSNLQASPQRLMVTFLSLPLTTDQLEFRWLLELLEAMC